MSFPDWLRQLPSDQVTYIKGGIDMPNTIDNERNVDYDRRQLAGKLLIEAPKGAVFQYEADKNVWLPCSARSAASFIMLGHEVRIAPTPKKVLKRWVEIFQLESKHPERTFLSLGVIALAKENLDKMAGKTREEIPGSETFPDEWFTEASK